MGAQSLLVRPRRTSWSRLRWGSLALCCTLHAYATFKNWSYKEELCIDNRHTHFAVCICIDLSGICFWGYHICSTLWLPQKSFEPVLIPTEQALTAACWCRKPTVTHRRRSIGVTCSADWFLLSLWAASSTLGWHRISVYTNFSGPSEHSEQCMQQHDCCHALACTPPGHHGLSRTVFSVCRHDSLFR